MAEQYSIVCKHHIIFTQSSMEGHIGCFCVLATVNNAAMNIGVHVFFWIGVLDFFRYIPRSGKSVNHVILNEYWRLRAPALAVTDNSVVFNIQCQCYLLHVVCLYTHQDGFNGPSHGVSYLTFCNDTDFMLFSVLVIGLHIYPSSQRVSFFFSVFL